MSFRERFRQFRGQVKEALNLESSPTSSISSLPIALTKSAPDLPLRAHSHSSAPQSDIQLIPSHVESQAKTGGKNAQLLTASNVGRVLDASNPYTKTVTPTSNAQGVPSNADPVTESSAEAEDNTAQATRSIPEIRVDPPIPNPTPTPIPRSLDNSRNATARSIIPQLGAEVAETTDDPGFASPVSLPLPDQISTPARVTRNDIPTVTEGPHNASIQVRSSLPSVPDPPLDANTGSQSLHVGEQNERKPLDTTSLPQVASTVVDAAPPPLIEQTRPELDARGIPQVITPMLRPAHENTGNLSPSASSLDFQTNPPIVAASSESEVALPRSNRPVAPILAPAKAKSTLAESAWKSLNGFRRVLGGIANEVGPLKLVMDELGGLIGMYEDAANTRTEYAAVRGELEELFSMLSAHFSGNVPPTMTAGINNLCAAIESELNQISTKEGRRTARRLVEAKQDVDEVIKCYRRIQGQLERLNLNVDLSIWKTVDEQASETRLKSLTPSLSACYNSAEALQVGRRECTPDTRKQVLADLSHWRHDKNQDNMYWLNGMAGTGKTTIAGSLCAILDRSHELGASFFCTRLLPECRDVKLILPTVAYQLARLSRPFHYTLSMALQGDPDLHTKALPIQLQGLLVDPLRKAAPALPEHLVIVIDALDECEDGQAVGLLLEILAKKATDLPLKVFVSSRPEPQIREKIGETKSKLILHELEASIVKQDIRLYLQTELLSLSTSISETELTGLVERTGVLFIYAATVVRYIKSVPSSSRRQKRVREVLEVKSAGSPGTNYDIDALYSTILASAFTSYQLNEEEVRIMKLVLDTVVCAQEPLTVTTIAGLLGLGDANLVKDALEPLWSVLHLSRANQLVSTLHASFPDYMLDPARSKHHGCQGDKHHERLAELCFDRIDRNERQFNICGLQSSYVFDDDVRDLAKRVQAAIPPDLWYACRYWAAHLKQGESSAERLDRVAKFVADRLLLWMEVLNLKKQISIGALMLEIVEQWSKEVSALKEARDLIHDAWRFVTMFATNDVSRSTAHLYISMLVLWPNSESAISHHVLRASGLATVRGTGMSRRQLALLGVIRAEGLVNWVAVSPDGMRIVSGSRDKTVRVWDARTGRALIDPLRGHTYSVHSVAFSSDGMHIVSGSYDRTIRVWDAQTGKALLAPFWGHTESVNSVAFSPDGMRILSGSDDKTIRVWDAQTGKPVINSLKGHTNSVRSVAFSPDGMRIVSGSDDYTIRMWDAQTSQALLDPFRGHVASVHSLSFSSDGMRIVSGSSDKTIRVWNAQTGMALFDPLMGHTDWVKSVAFSPDGMRIVSGSHDSTIQVWDAQTGKLLFNPLRGHTNWVRSVAFSPDGMRIISGSSDMTIRLWDAETGKAPLDPLQGHTSVVRSVAFSLDGMRIVSGSYDSTIRVWDAQTGKALLNPLKGHTDSIKSVACSPDGIRIVSGSSDNTIRVWNVRTGKALLDPLRGHTKLVSSVAFSPDGMRIASGSHDKTIRVWDTKTGKALIDSLRGHTKPVSSVAFSPDGMRIVSGSEDYTIRVWDVHAGGRGKLLMRPQRPVNSVAFSPDGMRIVSGLEDSTIRVWDAQTGRALLNPLRGHTYSVKSAAFSPDGMRIVSSSDDNTIRVWDARTGKALLDPLRGHTHPVNSVSFSPDGTRIVSGSNDKTVRMWHLDGPVVQSSSVMQLPESPFRYWMLNERGWVVDQAGRPLLWLPVDLRDRLMLPNMLFLISSEGSVELDFSDAKLGESWGDCYVPCPRI